MFPASYILASSISFWNICINNDNLQYGLRNTNNYFVTIPESAIQLSNLFVSNDVALFTASLV